MGVESEIKAFLEKRATRVPTDHPAASFVRHLLDETNLFLEEFKGYPRESKEFSQKALAELINMEFGGLLEDDRLIEDVTWPFSYRYFSSDSQSKGFREQMAVESEFWGNIYFYANQQERRMITLSLGALAGNGQYHNIYTIGDLRRTEAKELTQLVGI